MNLCKICGIIITDNSYNKKGGIEMIDEKYKNRVANLVKQAKDKGAIKSYKNFCKTKDADTYALSKDEIVYYTSASICNSR